MIAKAVMPLACVLPLAAAGFSMDSFNDQTHPAPGGRCGVYQYITSSTTYPTKVRTWICSGSVGVFVPSIDWEINDPKMTGLRQLWALSSYTTNSLPQVWQPAKVPPTTREVSEFLQWTPGTEDLSIPKFIGRYGLPNRYLTGQWVKGQVRKIGPDGPAFDMTDSLQQGQDFLIYDLPSGHAVALYVAKPPGDKFVTAIIIDSRGDLLVPNMVELLLPCKQAVSPRKITADADGTVTAVDASGRKESIGTWIAENGQLVITTTKRNSDTFPASEAVWLDGVEYAVDILVNDHEVICDPMGGRSEKPEAAK
jgi:hypothetical protein